MRRVRRSSLCIGLQVLQLLRSLALPVYACVGAAGNFAAASDAQEIVLNSVAIGFVFELDDFLYVALLNRSRRDAFEASRPRATSPLSSNNPRGTKVVSAWAWLCFVLDVTAGVLAYLQLRLPKTGISSIQSYYQPIRLYWFLRLGMTTAAQLHIFSHCHSGTLGKGITWRSVAFLRFCVAYTCVCLALGAGLFTFVVGWFDGNVGINSLGMLLVPEAIQCLMQMGDTSKCAQLHLDDAIYRKITTASQYLIPKAHQYLLAWGANYPERTLQALGLQGF